jgi:hypothetical protein
MLSDIYYTKAHLSLSLIECKPNLYTATPNLMLHSQK